MSSVNHIRYSPPEGVQMVETEEIRFKIGDAAAASLTRVMTCATPSATPQFAMAAAGTQNERLGDGPSVRRKDQAGDGRAVMEAQRDRETGVHAPCRA
jgi:hypothetical protein